MPRHRFTDTRDRIEKAAIRLFVEKGVTETSVRDIARAVDISEGALYRHFVSKDELVWALFERHYVEFAGQLDALAKAETTAHGKLAAMIRGFCQAHDENPTLFRFLLFVQHGQLSKLAPGTPTPVDAVRTVRRARHRVERDSRPASGFRHGTRLRNRAAAGHVRGLRPAAIHDGVRCATVSSPRPGPPCTICLGDLSCDRRLFSC